MTSASQDSSNTKAGRRWADWRPQRPPLLHLALLYAAYFLAGGFGQGLSLIPGVSIIFWPPVGILIATLLLNPKASWPWWILSAGLAELTCNAVWFHNPLPFALVYYAANGLEALTAAALINAVVKKPFRLASVEEVVAFVVLGGVAAPVVSATIIATTDHLIGRHPFTTAWPLVWLGDGSGLLVSTPLTLVTVLLWRERRTIAPRRLAEAVALGAILLATGWLSFREHLPTAYMLMPPLLWAAARFQLQGAAAAVGLVTLMTAMFTMTGKGEFAGSADAMHANIVMLKTFLAISAVSALLVGALSAQRQQALRGLKTANAELERRVAERTASSDRDRERLALALRTGGLGVYEWNMRDNSVWWSPEVYALYGVEPASFTPTTESFDALVHPDDRDELWRKTEASVARREVFMHEYRTVRPDGAIGWIHNRSHVGLDADGNPMLVTGVAADITERKQAEASIADLHVRLQQRVQELQTLLDVSPVGISIAEDADCRTIWINPALRQLLRMAEGANASKSAAPGEQPPFRVLRGGVELAAHELPMQRCIATGQPVLEDELEVVLPDGTTFTLSKSAVPLFDEAGKARGCIAFNLDITDRKRAETALKNADRRKDEFLATLAHELRNPLAPVRNAVQILHMRGPAIPELQWARDVIDRQVQHMARLIDDLLDVSRINQGKIELRREHVELEKVVQGAVEMTRPLIDACGHELTVSLPSDPVLLDADLTRLAQVFCNLLNNAAKYTERGGRIELRARPQGSDLVVSVRDSGIGIPADRLSNIFDMFSQVDGTMARSQGGLGIGLFIVKRLVDMHGGRIAARSDGPGKGSEFIVRLPMIVERIHSPVASHNDAAKPTGDLRILVVDDNRDAASTLAMLLKAMGNDVRIAHDGQEAVQTANQFQPQVVLLDIGMPKLNGYEAARAIRRQPSGKDTTLIAVTGWGHDDARRQAQDAGFDHHLVKPVDPQALMKVLAELNVVKT